MHIHVLQTTKEPGGERQSTDVEIKRQEEERNRLFSLLSYFLRGENMKKNSFVIFSPVSPLSLLLRVLKSVLTPSRVSCGTSFSLTVWTVLSNEVPKDSREREESFEYQKTIAKKEKEVRWESSLKGFSFSSYLQFIFFVFPLFSSLFSFLFSPKMRSCPRISCYFLMLKKQSE